MSSTERFRDMRHTADETKKMIDNPLTGEKMPLGKHDLSLPQIRDNAKLNGLFYNVHLFKIDPVQAQAVVEAMRDGKDLTDAQREFRENGLTTFNGRMALTEVAGETVTDKEVERWMDRHPELRIAVKEAGNPGEIARLMKLELAEFSVDKPDEFDRMIQNLKDARTLPESKEARAVNERVLASLRKAGISEAVYKEAAQSSLDLTMSSVDPAMRIRIEKETKKQMGFFTDLYDAWKGGALMRARAQDVVASFTRERSFNHRVEAYEKAVSELLLDTLKPDTRKGIDKALWEGGKAEKKDERTVKTLGEYKTLHEKFGEEARKKRVVEHLGAEAKKLGKKISDMDPAEIDTALDGYADKEFGMQEAGRTENKSSGLFGLLLGFLFPPLRTKTQLKDEAKTYI